MKYNTIVYIPKGWWGIVPILLLFSLLVSVLHNFSPNTLEQPSEMVEPKETVPEKMITVTKTIRIHKVQAGETLSEIADTYGIDMDTLRSGNENLSFMIYPGDSLRILPSKGALHIADKGDTFWSIGLEYGIDADIIIKANGKNNAELSIGEQIFVPNGKKTQHYERSSARGDVPVSRGGNQRFVYPTKGELTSAFGYRWGRAHNGIDLANDIGTPVVAARSGRVVHAGWYSGYGYTVVIEHEQGYTTLYGHLDNYIVHIDQYVKEGQVIAHMGTTGNSTGSHLHFEVWKNGTPMNPYIVLPS